MKQCPNCRSQITEEAAFCPVCGTAVNAVHSFPEPYPPQQPVTTPPVYIPPVPKVDPFDHTSKFAAHDISEHRLVCMLVYLLNFVGIILALLDCPDSPYARFHIRQSMKYTVLEILLSIAAFLLCWTIVVPVFALIALVVLMVLKISSFLQVCKGQAKEPAIVRSLKFLA